MTTQVPRVNAIRRELNLFNRRGEGKALGQEIDFGERAP